jgi:hypothetical protein
VGDPGKKFQEVNEKLIDPSGAHQVLEIFERHITVLVIPKGIYKRFWSGERFHGNISSGYSLLGIPVLHDLCGLSRTYEWYSFFLANGFQIPQYRDGIAGGDSDEPRMSLSVRTCFPFGDKRGFRIVLNHPMPMLQIPAKRRKGIFVML